MQVLLLGGKSAYVVDGHTNDHKAQDDSLKNLMMAWYFAGYYTGLHEGQQKATQKS